MCGGRTLLLLSRLASLLLSLGLVSGGLLLGLGLGGSGLGGLLLLGGLRRIERGRKGRIESQHG